MVYNRETIDLTDKVQVKHRLYLNNVLFYIRMNDLINIINNFINIEKKLINAFNKVKNIQSYIFNTINMYIKDTKFTNLKKNIRTGDVIHILNAKNCLLISIEKTLLELLIIIQKELQKKYNIFENTKDYAKLSLDSFNNNEIKQIIKLSKKRIALCNHLSITKITETKMHELSKKDANYLIDNNYDWNNYLIDFNDIVVNYNLYCWTIIYAVDILNIVIRQI